MSQASAQLAPEASSAERVFLYDDRRMPGQAVVDAFVDPDLVEGHMPGYGHFFRERTRSAKG
jgi:hypothetical protein